MTGHTLNGTRELSNQSWNRRGSTMSRDVFVDYILEEVDHARHRREEHIPLTMAVWAIVPVANIRENS